MILASTALAAVDFKEFADEAAFRAALSGDVFSVNIDSLVPEYGDLGSDPITASGEGLSVSFRAESGNLLGGYDAIAASFLTTADCTAMQISFLEGRPNAFGGSFLLVNKDNERLEGELTFQFNDGSTLTGDFDGSPNALFFGGYENGGEPFEWVRVSSSEPDSYVGVAGLTIGYSSIPEPSTYAVVLGFGVLAIVGVRRWRLRCVRTSEGNSPTLVSVKGSGSGNSSTVRG